MTVGENGEVAIKMTDGTTIIVSPDGIVGITTPATDDGSFEAGIQFVAPNADEVTLAAALGTSHQSLYVRAM